ncbi:UDP-2,3-diacetamido-2,3-dideoxy-D-glucuronate 2-epimerase (plasmid) [Sulfitobacter indolifex]|uniref:non-hydrolyzing UDP-N-acetylglucosamine 2-epimerase n=1 Tax=Sulfitobacter indolifex TaxID=225422 RepID=UPI001FAD01C6|nr:UDP-N-acetylglucosamine 2-epimerase (non-hydrolyzing) [Sulfitobacter indolifex]UOA20687.1 UDP-2,3-diacetamido-2,3-dideoxy-D-glucuronate 2-epimerase [Sulfitobacter indolifex]
MLIDIIAGARPNFMKIAPIIRALNERRANGGQLRYRLVHTGQHYENKMSGVFFEQLGISVPDINLGVGAGTQATQTAEIMVGYEKLLLHKRSEVCLVVGDVNSTMACALAAKKLNIPVAHVEAGIRSGDLTMPEEINRVVTDSITDWFFTTSEYANAQLRLSGVENERIFFVGNTMIDSLLHNLDRIKAPQFAIEQQLIPDQFLVTTLHRPSNVDNVSTLKTLIDAICEASDGLPVVFPVHPRTNRTLQQVPILPANLLSVDPQPYLEFIWLIKNSKGVITDSGGISEETTILNTPCLTMRNSTERPETTELGTNKLIGTSPDALAPAMCDLLNGKWKVGEAPEKWDGRAGPRIVGQLEILLGQR